MFRSIAGSTLAVIALIACNDAASIEQEQREERARLGQEQAEERRELGQEQAEERAAAAERAQNELAEQRGEVQEQQQELSAEARQLQQTVALACQGTPTAIADTCPIDRRQLTSTNNKNDGIVLHLSPQAGDEQTFERRLECYRARTALRQGTAAPGTTPTAPAAANAQNACVFDLADLEVDVSQQDDHVVVEITSDVRARVEELRAYGRSVTAQVMPSDDTRRN